MKLMSIQKEAQEIAASICEIVGVDVVIVDSEMARVADTFRYPYSRIDIHTRSIVGSIVSSGQPQVVENKNYFQSCVECGSRELCQMQGLIGVPILLRGTTIGAMGVVLERNNAKRLLENVSLVLTFLSQMADLLSSKLSSRLDSGQQHMSSPWEDVLDTVDSGVVLVDEKNTVVVHNKRFSRDFQIPEGGCHGKALTELVDHPMVAEALRRRVDVSDQPIIVPLAHATFYGSFHVTQMWQDGLYRGAVFTFRDTDGLPSSDILLYTGRDAKETIHELCGESLIGGQLQRRLHDPMERDRPIMLCGASEEYLLRLAVAIHNSAGRTGRFVLINGRSLYDAKLAKNPFLAEEDITGTLLMARRGTLCIGEVLELPIYIQRWLLNCLQDSNAPQNPGPQRSIQTQIICLSSRPLRDEDLPFQDPELMELLRSCQLEVPDPLGSTQRLRTVLERSLLHYSACYGKKGIVVEPMAWELLLNFPWDKGRHELYKGMEYLVRNCDKTITREAVAALQERLTSPAGSAKDYERREIQRLLDEGVSCDQIANILHISRATLYRRIKKYKLKTGKEVVS